MPITVLKVTLATLRDAADYKRLGKGVLEELATKVRGIGAEYFPSYVLDSNVNLLVLNEPRHYRAAEPQSQCLSRRDGLDR